jgi:type II secretory pathway component GspD/PulD (secretin)
MARKKIGRILSGGVIVACTVLLCTLNVSAQFQASEITQTISGSVGVPGVTMRGLVGSSGQQVVTDESGYYIAVVKWGWSGTVTPYKEGYTFDPPNKSYQEITGDQENQDYTAVPITYKISGTTGIEGVQMIGLPGDPVTASDGSYSVEVEYGWGGTVTPTKPGYNFTPASKPYRNVGSDMPRQDYKATKITLTISGSTGVEGVVMEGFPTKVVTGSNGSYSATVDWGWSGTVKPVKQGYTFIPEETPYTDVTFDQTNQVYTATPITFTISGSTGLAGVELKGFPESVFTDQDGFYQAVVPWGWSGNVTPERDGYTFKPGSMTYSQINSNRDNQVYVATQKTYTISGSAGQQGVQMLGLQGDPITGPGGSYSVTVPHGWTGTVTPILEGYDFEPPNKVYPPVTRDMTNENYSATRKMFEITGSVGVAGVTLQGVPGRAVQSGSDGTYRVSVPWGWSGTITPSKEGYEFNPPSMQYTNVVGPEMNRSYTATLLKRTISGTITTDKGQPVEGIRVMSDLNLSTTTDASGGYQLEVDHGWSGRVTPFSEGHDFRPTTRPYNNVMRDMSNQNYTAIVKTVTITDEVSMAGTPIPNVKITATGIPGSTATDTQGKFRISVPWGWTGEVMLEKPGYNFNPPSKSYTNVTTNLNMGIPEPEQPRPTPSQPTPSRPAPGGLPTKVPPTTTPEQPTPTGTGGLPERLPPTTEPGTTTTLPPTLDTNEPAVDPALQKIFDELAELKRTRGMGTTPEGAFDPGTMRISDTFTDDDLVITVLPSLSQQAGIPILAEESVAGFVTCTLDQVPLNTALDIVLANTPYVYKKTPYYYLVSPADPNSPLFPTMTDTRTVKLDYVRASSAVALLNDVFLPYVKADPDPNSHTVLVTASPRLMERIVEDLEKLDRTPTHVMLDARIVVMERGDLLNLGVEWGWPNIRAGVFSNELHGSGTDDLFDFGGKWPWGVSIGYTPDATFTNSIEMQLNLLQQNDEAQILSKPQVMALDGRRARIQVLKEEYYVLTSPQTTAFGFSTNYLQDITSGTTLTITPYIGDDNDITLEMAVEVSDSIPNARATDLPVVTRRTAENTVRIKDGGTAIVAGLTENRTSRADRRVPGLSNLPLIGDLFKNKNNESSSREIAVFVTAHIVPNDSLGVEFTGPSPTSMLQQQQQMQPLNSQFNQFQQQQPQPQYQMPAAMRRNDFEQSLIEATSRQR